MSRTTIMIILGMGAALMVGITAVIVGLSVFLPANGSSQDAIPTLMVLAATTTETPSPTPTTTITVTATGTAVSSTATQPATTSAATATAVQSNQSAACTNAATYVTDVTIPDDSHLQPGVTFVKTWRLKNSGSCTWDGRYQFVHAGGPTLGAVVEALPLPAAVAPGQTIDLSLTMLAPVTSGSYQSDWKLRTPQGAYFGVGRSSSPVWVKIVVDAPMSQTAGSISGYAWQDKDHDNSVDADESLPNVTITLATGTECRTVINSTKTDANGRFTFTNLAPNSYCLSGTDGSTTVSQSGLILAQNQQLTDVKVTWPPVWPQLTTISGFVYQDANLNGVYDNGETLMGSREVRLMPGTACHVQQNPQATAFSDGNGRYTLAGEFSGSYCVGVADDDGSLYDVVAITVTAGQTVNNINLKWPAANLSISGYLWNDYCLTNEAGQALDGNCVADSNGFYHADGMVQPTETYIAGVTMFLQLGSCVNNNNVMVTAVTDASGRYSFNSLQPATFCVSMNAATKGNADKLLPGDWTFPARGIWYQEITLLAGQSAFPVNFGWDFQLK